MNIMEKTEKAIQEFFKKSDDAPKKKSNVNVH